MSKMSIRAITMFFVFITAIATYADEPKVTSFGDRTVNLLRALISRPIANREVDECIAKFKASKADITSARIIETKDKNDDDGVVTSYSIMSEDSENGNSELFLTDGEGGFNCEYRTQSKK